ncbi:MULTISPECIES: efflux RND transporter periplasmic adaptor subunit [Acinetobacter]|uniref:efflux RND transporter periplasmic adaptor subunit n=1 Tax=Acinetobacter TaxID=469 RepID=UPI0013B097FD|nr:MULTISPECIES: efflux RND transporter periplasmic adaptor subunit [Acinetobacter]MDM1270919.1 efflux RND transporter periplasmic adaptor subunit [Acinetobacter indicus]MDM1290550.1 efflux RND transporter periplasmic adaptor subunit [Acinetobacter indicus]MDM1304828.1 efflux RND transporter periplasmic adaptor subunit [Acinetobacter indicus]MDM1320656.1 efflux RND transporter periplasmic adaptor subunit [Acinetobacter indicus]MDM1332434.1 efflux RND transporter periplasmic adaptor subunit [Ac
MGRENKVKKYQFGKISQPILISVLIGLTALISVWIWLGNQNEKNDEHGHDGEDEQHDDHAKESKEDQHSEEGEIELTAQQMVEHGLKVETVTQGEVNSFVTLPGKLVVNTDQQAHISPNFSGHVEQVNVALGQYVERGQTLAVLSVPELIDQQASLSIAQSSLRLAQQEYERERQLWSQGISAKQDLQRAENAYRQAQITVQSQQARLHALGSTGQNGRFVIRAPIPGMISQKDIVVGENVQLADQLFVIENLKDLWLEFNLPNTSNIQLQAGQILNFKTNGSDQNYQAKVQTLNSQADLQTGRLQVRAKVTTQADVLRPNVLVNVFVTDAQAKTALRVQKKALQQVEGKPVVFVIESEEKGQVHLKAQLIEVGVSSQDGQWLEVISGLTEGQKYIADGSFLLKSELEKDEAGHEH